MSKAKVQTKDSKTPQKDYRSANYCPICGSQVKGKDAKPHDDGCPYRT